MKLSIFLTTLAVFFFAAPTFAAHPLITDDTGTQGKGNFQLEVNGEYGSFTDDAQVKTSTTNLGATFALGFTDTIDLALTVPFQSITNPSATVSGMGDMAFEAKLRFYEKGKFSSLFKPGISFASGRENGLGDGGSSFWLLWANSISADPLELHLNLSYKTAPTQNITHLSAACLYKVFEGFRLLVNVGQDKGEAFTPAVTGVAGAIYGVTKNFDLDAGVKFGLTDVTGNDYSLMAGTAYRW